MEPTFNTEALSVIGSGTMGHSITLCAALAGINVKMFGFDQTDTERGLAAIDKKLVVLLQSQVLHANEIEEIKARITVTQSVDVAAEDSTFIIECIPENLDLKRKLFQYLDQISGRGVILASNTSGLSLKDMTVDTVHPERIIITHFWNPAHLVPLVEVLRGEQTDDRTADRTMALLKVMKKKAIEVKKEVPGLVGNRLQFALFREAQYLLEEGIATMEDIDAAIIYSIGRRLSVTGPFVSADMGGLDVYASISDNLFKDLTNADRSFPMLRELVESSRFGDKTGAGYYLWDNDFSLQMHQRREQELIRFLKEDAELDKL